MARKLSKKASKFFGRAMHELKHSGRSRPLKQRLAIAFSKTKARGFKVPGKRKKK